MSRSVSRSAQLATAAELLAIPDERRFHEVIGGEIVRKADPSGEHGAAQAAVTGTLFGPFSRRSGGRFPGGWWLETEVEIELEAHETYRPDIVGFRRDRVPDRPTGNPIRVRPDWVCEVLSPGNASNDSVRKMRVYLRSQIPHYWIVDPRDETLSVYRWTPEAYLAVLQAERGERVRAEPFDAIEIPVGVIFGDDAED